MEKITSASENAQVKISTEGITKAFGEQEVLKGIDLKIRSGEIFGLLGPSGAGKTTLIKILTGQIQPTEGSAHILGSDCKHLTSQIYTRIGMVLDNVGLYERLSCRDNLALFADIYQISKSHIDEVLHKVGLDKAAKRPVNRLSKGMKQRLALARSIMHQPEILFLDEPTSGLDPATAAYVHKLIDQQRESGTSIFLTTHNMEEAAKLCDHVALLDQGRIIEYGKPSEVCRKYNHCNSVHLLLKNGKNITLQNTSSSAETIAGYFVEGQVESIHSTEPDLETVFMELTGKGLEDGEGSLDGNSN